MLRGSYFTPSHTFVLLAVETCTGGNSLASKCQLLLLPHQLLLRNPVLSTLLYFYPPPLFSLSSAVCSFCFKCFIPCQGDGSSSILLSIHGSLVRAHTGRVFLNSLHRVVCFCFMAPTVSRFASFVSLFFLTVFWNAGFEEACCLLAYPPLSSQAKSCLQYESVW